MERNQRGKLIPDDKYIRPSKAFQILKSGQNANQTVYIYGATGFGKTSLVADFLIRKRYFYFSAQSQEEIAKIKKLYREIISGNEPDKPYTIVLDDLQVLDMEHEYDEMSECIADMVKSKRIWLILISRSAVPVWLKAIYVQNVFIVIGEDELRFTKEDEEEYFAKWGISPTVQTREQILKGAEGYPLYLRIIAMQLLSLGREDRKEEERVRREQKAIADAVSDMYDYMEIHVYDQWDIQLQEFIMDISIVDKFDLELARLITRKKDAGKWIQYALEIGNFLTEEIEGHRVIYCIRNAFRLAMIRRLYRRKTKEYINHLYTSAGMYYELAGDARQALHMYAAGEDEDSIARLLVSNTRTYAGAGNYWEFRKYYQKLPEKHILDNPELMAGMSLLQSILLNDEESDRWYRELADYVKQQHGNKRKLAKNKLLYLDIALPHRGISNIIDILKNGAPVLLDRNSELPEFSLTNNSPSIMNGGKDFCEWSKKDKELARSIGILVSGLLGNFGKGLVSLALAESYYTKGVDSYEVTALANQGRIQAEGGGKTEMVFVSVGILSQLAVLNNHAQQGVEMIESFRKKAVNDAPWLLTSIDTLLARIYLYIGKSAETEAWLKKAPNEDEEFCTLDRYHYMTKIRVYLSMGKREKAYHLAQRMLIYAEKRHRIYIQIEAQVLFAIVQYRMNTCWQQTLQKAITQAEEYGFVRILSREGAAILPLLKKVDFKWKKGFKDRVLTECEQLASYYPSYLNEKIGGVLLSETAIRILQLQSEGYSGAEIGKKLGMSADGVKYYNKETYKKLGVRSKAAAITEARNRRII